MPKYLFSFTNIPGVVPPYPPRRPIAFHLEYAFQITRISQKKARPVLELGLSHNVGQG
jgi:hypothetical protein